MRRFLPLIILTLVVSAGLGWLRAGTSAGPRGAAADTWNSLQNTRPSAADFKAMSARFKQSAFLPLTTRAEIDAAEQAGSAQEVQPGANIKAPPFPQIIGRSLIGNKRYIHIVNDAKAVTKLQQGDVLETGWEIKTVDHDRVIAVFDGEELEIQVIPYLKTAFERPQGEDGEDESGGPSKASGGE